MGGLASRLTLQSHYGTAIKELKALLESYNLILHRKESHHLYKRNDLGFISGGRTAGGAARFVLPNLRFDQIELKVNVL